MQITLIVYEGKYLLFGRSKMSLAISRKFSKKNIFMWNFIGKGMNIGMDNILKQDSYSKYRGRFDNTFMRT